MWNMKSKIKLMKRAGKNYIPKILKATSYILMIT